MSDILSDNNKETVNAGVDAVDVAEIGLTEEVPLASTIYHLARGAVDLGEAGIDHAYGDTTSETEHLKQAGVDGVEAVPGMALGAKFFGEDKIRRRLYGDKVHEPATPESVAADNAAGLESSRQYERDHPANVTHGPIDHHDPDDIKALYALQQLKFQAELDDQAKTGAYTKDGYAKPLDRPDMMRATEESDSMGGWAAAKGYQVASLLGLHAPSDDDLRAKEADNHTFHYGT